MGEMSFELDPKSGVPYYKQIILQVEMAIADGRFSAGTQLPTVRSLAVSLQINPNTVARAYNELEIRGIVTTQQGSGTFISDKRPTLSEVEREGVLETIARPFLTKEIKYGFYTAEIIQFIQENTQATTEAAGSSTSNDRLAPSGGRKESEK